MKHHKGRRATEFPDLNKLDDAALITGKVAQAVCGVSRSTRYRLEKAGHFPKGRKVGSMTRYVLGEVRAHAKQCAEAYQ
ncbi:helix-turn-helix transcriptional regulator [Luteimonas changyuni]|uniref:helix-turn-helix transcriptional regulator n=1 Tax=Luteimonas sp. MJ145 TaxID=3129234 RepID=UPI0031BA49A2